MKTTESTTIDGLTVSVTQLPGVRSMRMLHRISRVAAPALAKISLADFRPSASGEVKASDADTIRVFGELAAQISGAMSLDEFEEIWRELLYACTVNGKLVLEKNSVDGVAADVVFQGRAFTLLKVIGFALRVNYGGFIDGLVPQILAGAQGSAETRAPATFPKSPST